MTNDSQKGAGHKPTEHSDYDQETCHDMDGPPQAYTNPFIWVVICVMGLIVALVVKAVLS